MNSYDENEVDVLLKDHMKITKVLFSELEEVSFENLIELIKSYLDSKPINEKVLGHILESFSYVRPLKKEILLNIMQTFSISCKPGNLPMDLENTPIFDLIRKDEIQTLHDTFLCRANFDYFDTFNIGVEVNLLDVSAYYGSVKCFKHFLLNNVPFTKYVCPYSVAGGNLEIIRILESNDDSNNFSDDYCFDMSILYHRYAISDWLMLNYGHKMTNVMETSIKYFNFTAFYYGINNWDDSMPQAFLHDSCDADNLPVVQYLCEVKKVNSEAKVYLEEPALHYAYQKGRFDIVKYFFEVAKVNPYLKDRSGKTILHCACSDDQLQFVQYLCEVIKVNPETKDREGRTPLHIACDKGHLSIVQYLCEIAKVNTEAKDNDGRTPLHYACKSRSAKLVKYLCEVMKVNPEAKDNGGWTPLYWACHSGSFEVVQYLCEVHKVNPEVTSIRGETPLFKACRGGYLPIVQYLCEVQKVKTEGAMYRARLHYNYEICKYLRKEN